LPNML